MVLRNQNKGRTLFSAPHFCRPFLMFQPISLIKMLSGRMEVTIISVVGGAPAGSLSA